MKYISILRGINVSGQKKIKMTELKSLYESLGFSNVITYIQSGNVIFDSDENEEKLIVKQIEEAIYSNYDFQVPVIIRSRENIADIIKCNPFTTIDLEVEGSRVLVTFLAEPISVDNRKQFEKFRNSSESLFMTENHIYLYCPLGYGKTKLSNTLFERKLNVRATTRNWKTMLKLFEISN